jgi:hypothetical protein
MRDKTQWPTRPGDLAELKGLARLPCPCGTRRAPRPWRRGNKSLLSALKCPACGFKAAAGLPENATRNWNQAVRGRTVDAVQR